MVSKKSASSSVKTSRIAATAPADSKEPNRLNSPRVPKSGLEKIVSGHDGVFRPQPFGLYFSPNIGPTLATASTMIASTVVTTIEIRIAPLTRRTHSAIDEQQTEREDEHRPAGQGPVGAELDGHGGVVLVGDAAYDARVDEPDEGDEQSDADRDGHLQLGRHRVEHRRPEPGQHEDQDDQALEHDQAHRVGPRHLLGDREGHEGVQPEPGRQRQREVGDHAHQDRQQPGDQRRARSDHGEVVLRAAEEATGLVGHAARG